MNTHNSDRHDKHHTLRLAVGAARQKAQGGGGQFGTRTMIFVRELAREVSAKSTARVRVIVGLLSLLVLGLIVGLVWVIIHSQQQERNLSERIANQSEQLAETRRRSDEQVAAIRDLNDQLEAARTEAAKSNEKLADYVNGEMEALRERDVPLAQRFREFHRDIRRSTYLIVTLVVVEDPWGDEAVIPGFGTGWIISDQGHMITNKHVAKPWLFSELGTALRIRGMTVREDKVTWMAFPADSEIHYQIEFTATGQQITFQSHNAFATSEGTLEWLGMADNVWMAGSDSIHAMDTPNDLALFRINAADVQHEPLLCHDPTTTDWEPDQLTMVMAVGYPTGVGVLEGEHEIVNDELERFRKRVDTSPTLGEIRKIQDSIQVSCPIIPGNSGGPVLAYNEELERPVVIGVATAIARGEATHGICIPVRFAMDLLLDHAE